jgi:formate-dependent nitrite reductase membrane component NrfD
MKEELITSGRNLPYIDPHLDLWHWPIPLYLFLGGLAAGILFFAGINFIFDKEEEFPTAIKKAPLLVPIILVVGLAALFIDLKHQLYFWRLYTSFRIWSPMSWGAWVLLAITPLSFLWAASYLKEWRPSWSWRFAFLDSFERWIQTHRMPMAWAMVVLAVVLGIYTGILLSAFNARPLWNTAMLGPLFLVSGLSTGAATIIMMSNHHEEKRHFAKLDLLLIIIELFFIVHLFMGFLAGPEVQIDAVNLFITGPFALPFWGLVVGLGLVLPALLELLELAGIKIHPALTAFLVLAGGLIFRFIVVEAGEMTRYLY